MNDYQLRAEAMKLALLLPPNRDQARQVLDLLCALVEAFVWTPLPEPHEPQPTRSMVRRVP